MIFYIAVNFKWESVSRYASKKRPMDMSNLSFCQSRLLSHSSFGTKEYKLRKLRTGNLVQLAVIL